MAFKLSIVGLTIVAFVGPILIFLSAVVVWRRYFRTKNSKGVVSLGLDDNGWHELLKQKSDAAKLSSINLADVHLIVVEGKRSSSGGASRMGSGVLAAGQCSLGSTSTSSSGSSSSSRSMSCDEFSQTQHSIRACSVLTPPPAAVHAPDSHVVDTSALRQPAQTQQDLQQQPRGQGQAPAAPVPPSALLGQAQCVLGVPPEGHGGAKAPAASEGIAAYVAALLTAHTFSLGRIALARNAGAGTAGAQQQQQQHAGDRQPV